MAEAVNQAGTARQGEAGAEQDQPKLLFRREGGATVTKRIGYKEGSLCWMLEGHFTGIAQRWDSACKPGDETDWIRGDFSEMAGCGDGSLNVPCELRTRGGGTLRFNTRLG